MQAQFCVAGTHPIFAVSRAYTVAPGQRATIWVDHVDPLLAEGAVSSQFASDTPVVIERAMWWGGPTEASWTGVHVEGAGLGTRATFWGHRRRGGGRDVRCGHVHLRR